MKKATISGNSTLLDGGCNVCGIIEDVSYTLIIDQKKLPLEEVTVSVIVMAIVMENGYNREYEIDVLDDYVLFKKDTVKVRLKEEYNFLTYTTADKKIQTVNQISNEEQLADQINEIVTTLFRIEAFEFDFSTMDNTFSI